MRNCMTQVINLINAKVKCIWINTYEENSLIKDFREVSGIGLKSPMGLFSYSFASGLQKIDLVGNRVYEYDKTKNIDSMFKTIYDLTRNSYRREDEEMYAENNSYVIESKNNIFILKDFHLIINNPNVIRQLKDVVEGRYINYNTIIVVSPINNGIPVELEKIFTVVDYQTPDEELIANVLDVAVTSGLKNMGTSFKPILVKDKERIIKACKGLTFDEITHIFKLSSIVNNTITLQAVNDFKIDLIKKSDILEYKIPKSSINEIGGNDNFKEWIEEVVISMSPEAQAFGCAKSKGYLALGVPGSAKTALAESLASSMNVPFLKLDMSKIMDSKVGSSEKNISQAIKMIKATAPCLLLVDEVEKTLSGIGSSNNSDSGTMARVIGSILEFLSEDHGVFVVMTSNDVSQLPPELTRTGRLDAIWYFGLPNSSERKEIFKIHFNKYNKNIDDEMIDYAVSISGKFTGAEIQEAVKNSIKKAFIRYKKDNNPEITKEDIEKACGEIVPISKSSREKIAMLEEYAKNRARNSSKAVDNKEKTTNNLLSIRDLK